ncbi:MAG: amino acid adenylation domain-containing protein [Isosphaeraceae bacterium]
MNSPLRDLPELSVEEKRALVARLLKERAGSPGARAGNTPPTPHMDAKRALVARLLRGRQGRALPAHRMIEARARLAPDAIAAAGRDGSLTYRELDERSNRLARHLRDLGVGPDVLVGLCAERTTRMLVGLLGILKAGGAYVPLDPGFPAARLAYMLGDAQAPVLVTESHLQDIHEGAAARVVCLDEPDEWADQPSAPIDGDPADSNLAYVIYTSGSTGKPKGVMVTHGGLANFLASMRRILGVGSHDTLLAVTTLSFDIAALELFLPLTVGARLAIASRDDAIDPVRLARLLDRERATILQATPATWRMLLESGWRGDRRLMLLCGGEAMPRALADRLLPCGRALWNLYGPTETTIWSSAWRVEPGDGPVSIGRPIDATQLYVLDSRMRPVPAGLVGELFIGGSGLARGYLNRPELTAEKFVPDPFARDGAARMYRTGDLARWLPDGTLECLGRADHQVKVRGFRIEPGEVEAALARQDSIRDAAVVARPDATGELMLVAFIVPADGPPDIAEIRQALKADLPEYMVPSAFVAIDALPLTPNGKVDRNALPSSDGALTAQAAGEYVAPRGPIETELAGLWGQLLRRDQVGAHDDFFELGGHSLFAAQALSRLRDSYGIEVSLRDFLESPTVAALARQIEEAQGAPASPSLPPLRPVPRSGDLPLSYAQQAMWFLDQLTPGLPTFNITAAARIRGPLDLDALGRAFAALVDRHEVLRTAFVARDGRPVQVIRESLAISVPLIDLGEQPPAELDRQILEESRTPFDLTNAPLARASVLRLGPDDHAVLLSMHHIITDGWSFGVAARELTALYGAFAKGLPSPLADLPVQFADYAAWQREWLAGEVRDRLAAFWKARLEGVPALELPTDRPRPPVRTARGGQIPVAIPRPLVDRLHALSRREGATLYMTLLAAFQAWMARLSGQDDFAVGSPVANRNLPEIAGLIGYFVNVIALRTSLAGNPTFRELLGRARSTVLEAFENQDLPLDQVVEAVQPPRDPSRTPIFQVMFALQNNEAPEFSGNGLEIAPLDPLDGSGTAKFDLTLGLAESAEGLTGLLEFDRDLFDRATVGRLAGHFVTLLESIADQPNANLNDLALLRSEERAAILRGGLGSRAKPFSTPIHWIVRTQAEAHPSAIAVVDGDRAWTYRDLERRANQLAHALISLGVAAGARVAIALPKSPEMLAAILGTLKAGGAYVPLDLEQPTSRLADILGDARPRVLVAAPGFDLPWVGERLRVTADLESLVDWPTADPEVMIEADQLAYLIYTSGSTGTPKGVMVPHRGLPAVLRGWVEAYHLDRSNRHLQMAGPAFDVFTGDWIRALGTGAALVLCPKETLLDPPALAALIASQRIDSAEFVPAVASALIDHLERSGGRLDTLRLAVVGSDAWRAGRHERLRRLCHPQARVINSYGLTEATIDSTYFEGDASAMPAESVVPIGRPFAGARVYILDRGGNPSPIGVPGELCVGGPGVALGYWDRPELSAEKFVGDRFAGEPGAKMYRTGDHARWQADGTIEFLGRGDAQVKVRGFRIELGEVESALSRFPEVADAVVVARPDGGGGSRLDAYVVPRPGSMVTGDGLLRSLAGRLPGPMVPSTLTLLERLPRNHSGKVDRLSLPEPALRPRARYLAPRTATEKSIAEVWSALLLREEVGVEDNFFDLGGHSLLAFRAISELRQRLGVACPVRLLFEAPTVGELAGRLDAIRGDSASTPGPSKRRDDWLQEAPQSLGQEALWFLDQVDPGRATYNIPAAGRVRGPLDLAALRAAVGQLVDRHEILRTTFLTRDGRPSQAIVPSMDVAWEEADLTGMAPGEAQDREVERRIRDQATRPFDLARGPLFRVWVARLGDRDHALAFVAHHIILDGWSFSVAARELGALYEANREGRPLLLPALPLQYADYAAWQHEMLGGPARDRLAAYWREQLDGVGILQLPTDRPRSPRPARRAGWRKFTIPAELAGRVRSLGLREGATPFMTLMAAFQVLLARHGGQDDFAIGVPSAGRDRAEFEGLIGYFLNVLPIRADLSGNPTFRELLGRVRAASLGAFEHQAIRVERLLEEAAPRREPLYRAMFAYQSFPAEHLPLPGLIIEPIEALAEEAGSKFDLTLTVDESGDALEATLEYDADLFESGTAGRMAGHLLTLLEGIADDPDRPVRSLPMLPDAERAAAISLGRSDVAPILPYRPAHRMIEAQAAATPGSIAAESPGYSRSYGELNDRANRLAAALRGRGIGVGSLVAVALERTPDLVAALLAVMKSGAGYVPIDPAYPWARIAAMLEDAAPAAILTERSLAGRFAGVGAPILEIDDLLAGDVPVGNPEASPDPDDIAYVIFTSGSTGKPKGVMVTHGGLANFLASMRRILGVGSNDTLLAVTTLSFDIAALELFLPLTVGARLAIASRDDAIDPVRLARLLDRERATILQATPATWRMLLESGWRGDRRLMLLCGGEAMPRALADRLLPCGRALWNLYGPTETTIWSSAWRVEPGDGPVSIGRPIDATQLYVLDQERQPLPIGVPGELYIGGAGVARGYLNRSEMTAERFPADPWAPGAGARMYRTGDLARWLPDGTLECLGRADHQVKVRGFRIELGEVEGAIAAHDAVGEAAAVVVGAEESRRLVAYATASYPALDASLLKAWLRDRLPEYMVPSRIVLVEALPKTRNGKIDRQALAARPLEIDGDPATIAPRDPVEARLLPIWEEVLAIRPIGVTDNFFDLGGHSVLAFRLLARVESEFGRALPLGELASDPTIEGMARVLRGAAGGPSGPIVRLQPSGSKPPLFFAHPLGGLVYDYRELSRALGDDRPFLALQAAGIDRDEPPDDRIEAMAARYLEAIRRVQPAGPYHLGGWSLGGPIAFEMARRLKAEGEEIASLVLIDAGPDQGVPFRLLMNRLRRLSPERFRKEVFRIFRLDRLREAEAGAGWIDRLLGVVRANIEAALAYEPAPYDGPLTVIRARGNPATWLSGPSLGWKKYARGPLRAFGVEGDHYSILHPPHLDALATAILEAMEARP